jgi:hypothetical protein
MLGIVVWRNIMNLNPKLPAVQREAKEKKNLWLIII